MKLKKEFSQNLYEALDAKGRPLCLLSIEEILNQKLYHRRIALMVVDKRAKMLLNAPENGEYDFLFSGPVPAAWASIDYAEQSSLKLLKSSQLHLLCELAPSIDKSRAFCSVYRIQISNPLADMLALNKKMHLLLDMVELDALMSLDLAFSPFFKQFYHSHLKKVPADSN